MKLECPLSLLAPSKWRVLHLPKNLLDCQELETASQRLSRQRQQRRAKMRSQSFGYLRSLKT
jgi:hypothetical protein